MFSQEFFGTLVKHQYTMKDERVFAKMSIRHVANGAIQTFLDPIQGEANISNVKSLFTAPVRWKKVGVDTTDWEKRTVIVKFDEVEFEGELVGISISHKEKKDVEVFEYTIDLLKEVGANNEDTTFAASYLKVKEENEDGKMVAKQFAIEIDLDDEVSTLDEVDGEDAPF